MVAQSFLNLASAFGLSTSAGLNAYIPLLVFALGGRLFPSLVTLNEPWTPLTSWWVIGTLVVLLAVEILVDKIPAVDTVNDIIQTIIRPAAGAILFAASTNAVGIHPVIAAICGVILAGGVHAAKAGSRPALTAATAGAGNPIVSTIEDIVSFTLSVLSVVAPYLVVAVIVVALGLALWWYLRRKKRAKSC